MNLQKHKNTAQAQHVFLETVLQTNITAQAGQYCLKKRTCKKHGAGTTVFSRKAHLQNIKEKRRKHNSTVSEVGFATSKTAQAQQYFFEKRIYKKLRRHVTICSKTWFTNKKRRGHNSILSKGGFATKNKRLGHNSMFSENGWTNRTTQSQQNFFENGIATKRAGAGRW